MAVVQEQHSGLVGAYGCPRLWRAWHHHGRGYRGREALWSRLGGQRRQDHLIRAAGPVRAAGLLRAPDLRLHQGQRRPHPAEPVDLGGGEQERASLPDPGCRRRRGGVRRVFRDHQGDGHLQRDRRLVQGDDTRPAGPERGHARQSHRHPRDADRRAGRCVDLAVPEQ